MIDTVEFIQGQNSSPRSNRSSISRVSYFLQFFQQENHVINSMLVLLRHLNQMSPFKIGRVLMSLDFYAANLGATDQG
jgi:hypothetical protein